MEDSAATAIAKTYYRASCYKRQGKCCFVTLPLSLTASSLSYLRVYLIPSFSTRISFPCLRLAVPKKIFFTSFTNKFPNSGSLVPLSLSYLYLLPSVDRQPFHSLSLRHILETELQSSLVFPRRYYHSSPRILATALDFPRVANVVGKEFGFSRKPQIPATAFVFSDSPL